MREKIRNIIIEILGCPENELKDNLCLKKHMEADSIDMMELIMEIEETLEVNLPDEILKKSITVNSIVDIIENNK